jgi:hypothetical protein
MSWGIITEDWRLKLLAAGLAVLMLGAVAFSQNPPTSLSLTVGLTYANVPSNLILISPPSKATVTYAGTADEIAKVNTGNLTATVDVAHAKPGNNVQLNVVAKTTVPDVNVQNPAPISVNIDTYIQGQDLPVQTNAHPAPGWAITDEYATCPGKPCVVHFSGPASWLKNMTATVTYASPVSIATISSPNVPIQLVNSNGAVDLTTCRTVPCAYLDTLTATINIGAVPGSSTTTAVLLDSPWTHGPANGYRVYGITITPNPVVISGDPVLLAKVHTITLPAVNLSGLTSDTTFTINIPYPDGISGLVATVTLKYLIQPNPAITPSPTS